MYEAPANVIFTLCLLTLSLVFPPEVVGAGVERRVVFPKGRTAVSYRGKLPLREGNYDAYFFPSRKMRTLTAKLTCDDPEDGRVR